MDGCRAKFLYPYGRYCKEHGRWTSIPVRKVTRNRFDRLKRPGGSYPYYSDSPERFVEKLLDLWEKTREVK